MAKAAERIIDEGRLQDVTPAREFASSGWVIEVLLVFDNGSAERRFFAVGAETAASAEEVVLSYPGITRDDKRVACRLLSPKEIADLRLRTLAVRPYGWSLDALGEV